MSVAQFDQLTCGALGCTEPATKRVRHPDHGEIVVCDGHAADYEVVDDV